MASTINLTPTDSKKFVLHNGQYFTTAQIQSTTYDGATTVSVSELAIDGISLSWDGADAFDPTSPIIGSTCKLTMLVDHNDELNVIRDLLAGGEADTWIQLITNNGSKWYGNLLPEEARIDVTDGITRVQLRFGDGLGLLKDIDFKASDGRPYSDGTTAVTPQGNLLKWAYLALQNIPWMQEAVTLANLIRETPVLEPTDGTQEGFYGTFLSDTFTPAKSFEMERSVEIIERDRRELPRGKSFTSAYDVLVDICQTSGYRLTWNMTGWHFFSPLAATSDYSLTDQTSYVWSTSDFSTIATGSQGYDVALGKALNNWSPAYDLDAAYAMADSSTTWAIPVGSVKATHLQVGSGNVASNAAGFGGKYTETDSWDLPNTQRRKFRDPTMEITDGAPMRLRFHAFCEVYNYPGVGSNWEGRAGMKPCIVAKIACGTETGTTHYLKGDVKHAPEFTTMTGVSGPDIQGKSWNIFDDATWTTDSSDLLYVPFNNKHGASPIPEEITYLNSDGDVVYSFPMPFNAKLKGDELNKIKEDQDYDSGTIEWARNFDAPTGQGNFTGLQIELGLAVFGWDGTELYNSLDHTRASEQTNDFDFSDIFRAADYKRMIREFEIWDCVLALGDNRESDRIYFAEGGRGSIPIQAIETRIATRNGALWAGAPSTLSFFKEDQTLDSDCDVRMTFDTGITSESNIDLLGGEYLRLLDGSAEGVETSLIPKFDTVTGFITPDLYVKTDCLGGTTHIQPTSIEFNSTTGADLSGYVVDRRGSVSMVVKPPTVDIPTPVSGRPQVSAVNPGTDGTNSFFGKSTGANIAANLEVQTQLALMDDGLLELSTALGDTGTIVDGTYNGIQFDETGATNGQALVYTSGTWQPGTITGGSDLEFTQAFTITDPVGNQVDNSTVSVGDDIEAYLRDMVTSFQTPSLSTSSYFGSSSSTLTKVHGTTMSDSSISYALTNFSNVNTGDSGSVTFSDTIQTNQQRTFTPSSSGSVSFSPSLSFKAKVVSSSTAGTGSTRSRSSAYQVTVGGLSDTNGNSISSVTKKCTVVYRSRICKSTTNFAGGITNTQGTTLFAAAHKTQNASNPFNTYQDTNGFTSTEYLYYMIPECIHTYLGGTTTGIGTLSAGFGGSVSGNTTPVWCGSVVIAPVGGLNVKYHVLRVGSAGAYSGSSTTKLNY